MLQEIICTVLWALALRWAIFRYQKTAFIRQWLRSLPEKAANWGSSLQRAASLASELSLCVYCQTVEAALIVSALQWLSQKFHLIGVPYCLTALTAGWMAIILDGYLEAAIENTEERHAFPLSSPSEES